MLKAPIGNIETNPYGFVLGRGGGEPKIRAASRVGRKSVVGGLFCRLKRGRQLGGN